MQLYELLKKQPKRKKAAAPKIRVTYSRPAKKGRKVFGELLKFNQPWRFGANESTEILFLTDVVFGGKEIKAGRYSLIVIPTASEWTLKLHTELDGWGNYSYDASNDLASVTVPVQESKKVIENLSIALYEASPNSSAPQSRLGYYHCRVPNNFKVKIIIKTYFKRAEFFQSFLLE